MNQVLIWLVAEWACAGRALLPQIEIGIVGEDLMSRIKGKLQHMLWEGLDGFSPGGCCFQVWQPSPFDPVVEGLSGSLAGFRPHPYSLSS